MPSPLKMLAACGALVLLASGLSAHDAPSSFRGMDKDHDGRISRDEHAAATKGMFALMDGDKDGKVTASEMDAAHEKVTGEKAKAGDMPAADKIKVIDTSKDGMLTAEEHEKGARSMFEKMDTNKDGALTQVEMKAGHAKMLRPPAQ